MNCLKCGTRTKVLDTRSDRDEVHCVNTIGTVRRRRKCLSCGYKFTTAEITQTDYDLMCAGEPPTDH